MRNENPLKKAIADLKVNGDPIVVTSEKERTNAHNIARYMQIKIRTQRRLDGAGTTS